MTDTTPSTMPYQFVIELMGPVPTATSATTMTDGVTNTWAVHGAYLTVQGDVYTISDSDGNVVAAVHTFGTIITRHDATTYNAVAA